MRFPWRKPKLALGTVLLEVFLCAFPPVPYALPSAVTKEREPRNWFYVAVLILGTLFTLTACAYGWMAFLATKVADPRAPRIEENPLLRFLDEHGLTVLVVELAALTLASVGALALDQYRTSRRAENSSTSEANSAKKESAQSAEDPSAEGEATSLGD